MSEKKADIAVGIRNSALIKNPVLFEAIGIAPVVAMATSLKAFIMLAAISVTELIITESLACLLLKKVKSSLRVLIYAVLGVLVNIPFFLLFNHFAPNETAKVSIFLPVMAVNSLVALHCERVAVKSGFKETLLDAFSAGIGYIFVIFIISIVREILGSGTIYGKSLSLPVTFSGLSLPFGGFLLLGFLAAVCKRIIGKKYPDEKPEAAFNLSEISQSHIGSVKDLFEDDFNPFDELVSEEETDFKKKRSAHKEKTRKAKAAPRKKASGGIKAKQPKNDSFENTKKHTDYVSEFDDLLNVLAEAEKAKAEENVSQESAAEDDAPKSSGDVSESNQEGGDEQ